MHILKQTSSKEEGWQVVAALISQGDLKRALGVLRLLSQEIEDRAFILQLEGDLLLAFNDKDAIMKYKQAAFLYQKEKKVVCALGVYEHLLDLEPGNFEFLSSLCECYALLDWPKRLERRFCDVFAAYAENKVSAEQVIKLVETISRMLGTEQKKAQLREFLAGTSLPITPRLLLAL